MKTPSCKCGCTCRAVTFFKICQMMSVSVTFGLFRGVPLTFGKFGKSEVCPYLMTHADVFASGVMVTQFIITPLIFICHRLNIQRTLLEPMINTVLCLFSLISGFIALSFWRHPSSEFEDNKGAGFTMCSFCFITAVFYFMDTIGDLRTMFKTPSPSPPLSTPAPSSSTA